MTRVDCSRYTYFNKTCQHSGAEWFGDFILHPDTYLLTGQRCILLTVSPVSPNSPTRFLQRVVFPVEASLNRLLWNRSISPNSLLETSISEEVRPRDLEEEEATQTLRPLLPPSTTSRRHTLAEVSARFHQCNPPC